VRYRIAFIDYFPTHYRRGLYEELSRRHDADFYFFADERERYWNAKIPLAHDGEFHEVSLRRWRLAGQAVMPGVALALTPRRYDAVIKSLNGKVMLPLTFGTARMRGLPFVLWTGMWAHPDTPVHRVSRPLTDAIYRASDAIVAYGEHVRRFVSQTHGVAHDKVFVAGQAVDPRRFTAIAGPPNGDELQILYVGQFEERKGLRYLLDAVAELGDLPIRLRLVGNGSGEREIRERARTLRHVEVVGYVPQDALPAELAACDCLVLPSITTALDKEPWGLVVNEAMHAARPVIATDAVGAAAGGLVRDGETGLVVPERRPDALAGAIRRLAERPQLRAGMGMRAREAAATFTHARMVDAFEAAVEYAVGRRGG
jgi:glycosyltransferase involved in cell wall biosynthesis